MSINDFTSVIESLIAVKVAVLRLKDETLPLDEKRHFFEELMCHGRHISEVGHGGLAQLPHPNGKASRLED